MVPKGNLGFDFVLQMRLHAVLILNSYYQFSLMNLKARGKHGTFLRGHSAVIMSPWLEVMLSSDGQGALSSSATGAKRMLKRWLA